MDDLWKILLKWMIWGYHYFWKHSYVCVCVFFWNSVFLFPVVSGKWCPQTIGKTPPLLFFAGPKVRVNKPHFSRTGSGPSLSIEAISYVNSVLPNLPKITVPSKGCLDEPFSFTLPFRCFCQVSSQGVLQHLWHLFEWWPATWRGYIKVAMEETSTSVKNNQHLSENHTLLEDPPFRNWFLYHQKIMGFIRFIPMSWWMITVPSWRKTRHQEIWIGHLVAESGRGWTRLQPGSITHQQPQPQLCPPNLHHQSLACAVVASNPPNPMVNSTSAQFHIRPPALGQEVPTTQGLWKKFLVAVRCLAPCANSPSLQRKYIYKSWIFQPRPESLLLDGKVIPLSIEGCFRQHVPCSACPQYFSFAQWRSVQPPCAKQSKSLHVPVVFIFLLPTEKWIIFPVIRMVFCLNYQGITRSRFLAATQPSSTHHSDSQCFHTWRGTWINSGGADKKHILKLRISPMQSVGGWWFRGWWLNWWSRSSKEPTFWLFEGSSWRCINK